MVILGHTLAPSIQFNYACTYHVFWCPKYRRAVLTGEIETRLKSIIAEAVAETTSEIVELEVMPAHVPLLVSIDPQYGVHRLVKHLKGRSSRIFCEEFPSLKSRLPSLWTHSYFVATVGGAPLQVIKHYVENQKNA